MQFVTQSRRNLISPDAAMQLARARPRAIVNPKVCAKWASRLRVSYTARNPRVAASFASLQLSLFSLQISPQTRVPVPHSLHILLDRFTQIITFVFKLLREERCKNEVQQYRCAMCARGRRRGSDVYLVCLTRGDIVEVVECILISDVTGLRYRVPFSTPLRLRSHAT
jgi:hypothetical protein